MTTTKQAIIDDFQRRANATLPKYSRISKRMARKIMIDQGLIKGKTAGGSVTGFCKDRAPKPICPAHVINLPIPEEEARPAFPADEVSLPGEQGHTSNESRS